MAGVCSCRGQAEYQLAAFRENARCAQSERVQRLTLFKDGISDGAYEVAVRHLFLAGVYAASLDNGFTRSPDDWMILDSLAHRIMDQDELLVSFYSDRRELVRLQSTFLDVERILRGTLRRRRGVEGRLTARVQSELRQALEALERLDRLSMKLVSWRENMRLESSVRLESLFDMHDDERSKIT